LHAPTGGNFLLEFIDSFPWPIRTSRITQKIRRESRSAPQSAQRRSDQVIKRSLIAEIAVSP
jgi:hypothetical protein